MPVIKKLTALEILDSRGRPTVQTACQLESGATATVSVPSGASTGTAEALELRDGDPNRYRGLGCRKAVQHVNRDLNDALVGQTFEQQSNLDQAMLTLDGTANKSRLGANALLSEVPKQAPAGQEHQVVLAARSTRGVGPENHGSRRIRNQQ